MSQTQLFKDKTLCIFGCGYVGEAVAREALKLGMTVTALTRNPDKAKNLSALGIHKVVVENLERDVWHSDISAKQDYVLNCVSSAGGGMEGYRQSYINGQKSILRWAGNGQIGTLVYTSSTSVYSQSDGELVHEDAAQAEQSPAGKLLLEAEQVLLGKGMTQTPFKALMATQSSPHPGVGRSIVLRLGGIYGPDRHYLLDALRRKEMTFAGRCDIILNYIHQDDIVSAVFASFTAPEKIGDRIYNVVDGAYPTKAEIVNWLAEQLGLPEPVFDSEVQTKRATNRQGSSGKLPNRRVDNSHIREELGWSPKYNDYREGYASFM